MKVAIIGRPNVGKSTLFNALTRTRDALAHDRPGITRDVISGTRDGITFLDTAGLESADGGISGDSTGFAIAAAARADAALFVVDGRAGLRPTDAEWAGKIKRAAPKTAVLLVANKCESFKAAGGLEEFYKLGFGDPIPVSAEHNIGLNEIIGKLKSMRPAADEKPADEKRRQSIAIMGQPNAGKSTLINRILGERRVLVRDEPGITRDAVKIPARCLGREIEIIDTAGLRRKSRVDDDIETLAALKALDAMDKSDAAILLIDATKGIERQSVRIAGRICEAGRVFAVALNKWDLIGADEREKKLAELKRGFKDAFGQITKPLVVPISAENGTGVDNMMKRVYELLDKSNERAPTSLVNRAVEKLVAEKHPPMSRLRRPMKIKFASQTGIHPNTITIRVGGASDIPESYTRYLRRGISEALGWESIPVVIRYAKDENPFA